MLLLQSPLLTLANLIFGGRARFFIWAAVLEAMFVLIPFSLYGARHPWLHLLEFSVESLQIVGILITPGIVLMILFGPLLEMCRQNIDKAITAPARRRLESERKPLILDNPR